MSLIPVIAVVGPTASGKTALAIELAKALDGEIISADSMQVYKGMDIATAKPTLEERQGIPHYMMDVVDTSVRYSAALYAEKASEHIRDIHARGKLPIVAGGTGLYVDTLLKPRVYKLKEHDMSVRTALEERELTEGIEALFEELNRLDKVTADKLHINNRGRIIRALEVYYLTGRPMSEKDEDAEDSPYRVLYIGLDYKNRSLLYDRINKRVDIMLENGLVSEARQYKELSDSTTAARAIGHKELLPYLKGEKPLNEVIEKLKRETRRYAKRQLTWFRKNDEINWLYIDCFDSFDDVIDNALSLSKEFLAEESDKNGGD